MAECGQAVQDGQDGHGGNLVNHDMVIAAETQDTWVETKLSEQTRNEKGDEDKEAEKEKETSEGKEEDASTAEYVDSLCARRIHIGQVPEALRTPAVWRAAASANIEVLARMPAADIDQDTVYLALTTTSTGRCGVSRYVPDRFRTDVAKALLYRICRCHWPSGMAELTYAIDDARPEYSSDCMTEYVGRHHEEAALCDVARECRVCERRRCPNLDADCVDGTKRCTSCAYTAWALADHKRTMATATTRTRARTRTTEETDEKRCDRDCAICDTHHCVEYDPDCRYSEPCGGCR